MNAVTITITVRQDSKGARKITLDGAAAGEMPMALEGNFSELHALIDRMWVALMRREPQPVTVPPEKKVKRGKVEADDDSQDGDDNVQDSGQDGDGQDDAAVDAEATADDGDQLVTGEAESAAEELAGHESDAEVLAETGVGE